LFLTTCQLLRERTEFGYRLAQRECVKQLNTTGETKMAMEKKSLASKKTAPATKSKTTKSKVDTSKPSAAKVVAARNVFQKP
jgi:hypothetical protein